ncbi:MAG: hypothetical protein ACJ0G0_05360 [Alphaproteobacteria bacterium]
MKKIKNFSFTCKKIQIPLKEIKTIEKCIKLKSGKVYIVGGAVRDLILNNNNNYKADLVVDLEMFDLLLCLKKYGLKYIPLGIKFGSIVVVVNNIKIDVTIMRHDVGSDGRWAEIEFTKNIMLDSERRDFSFNSIYCDTKGYIYDPNKGVNDLMDGCVRFIGDINKRVKEDFLRIIRFYRFSIFYAKNFNSKTIKTLVGYHQNLKTLSFERKLDEIKKILNYKKLHQKIKKKSIINEIKILFEESFDMKFDFENFDKFCELEYRLDCIDFERRFKYLMRNSEDKSNFVSKINKKFKKRLLSKIVKFDLDEESLRKMLYKNNKFCVEDNVLIQSVEKRISYGELVKTKLFIKNYKKKKFPLGGQDLVKIGFKRGKEIGKVLKSTESWWIKNNFSKNKKSCLEFAIKYLP